ncbi:uncharacterized protein LOC144103550 [Amblyomma americanum]
MSFRPRLSDPHDHFWLEEYDVLSLQEVYFLRNKLHLPGSIGYGRRSSCQQPSCLADPCLEDSHPPGPSRAAIFVHRTLAQMEILLFVYWSVLTGACPSAAAACIGPSLGESRQARLLLMPSSTTAQLAALRLAADILDSHSTILSYSRVALQLLQEPAPYC